MQGEPAPIVARGLVSSVDNFRYIVLDGSQFRFSYEVSPFDIASVTAAPWIRADVYCPSHQRHWVDAPALRDAVTQMCVPGIDVPVDVGSVADLESP